MLEIVKIDNNIYQAVVAVANKPNSNRRIYSDEVLDKLVKDSLDLVSRRGLLGEFKDESYGEYGDNIIKFATASHLITKLSFKNDLLCADIEILNTNFIYANKLKEALSLDNISFRLRGLSQNAVIVNDNGILLIKDYKLITIDAFLKNEASKFDCPI